MGKLIFFYPISADGKKVPLPFWGSSQSFRFYLLPSGHRVQTPVGFHSVGDPSEVTEYR